MKLATSLLLAMLVFAQPGAARADGPPADEFADGPAEELHISLAGVTLGSVVEFLSIHTGKPVLLPDRFPGDSKVDVVSGRTSTVTPESAEDIFTSMLRQAGFTILERPGHLEVVPAGRTAGLPVHHVHDGGSLRAHAIHTKVVRLEHARVGDVASVLEKLKSETGRIETYPERNMLVLTDYGVNLTSMLTLMEALDSGEAEPLLETYAAQHVPPDELRTVARTYVQNLKQQSSPAIRQRLETLAIEVNPATNELIFTGRPEHIEKVRDYVARHDVESPETDLRFHVYNVLNREARELKSLLESTLEAEPERGGRQENRPRILADEINNDLLIVADQRGYERMRDLLRNLDRPRAQVEIVAAVVEMSTERLFDLGVELSTIDPPGDRARGFAGTAFGLSEFTLEGRVPLVPPDGGVVAGVFKDSIFHIPLLIRASQMHEDISFIAAPRITTADGKPATVKLGERREFLETVLSPDGTTTAITSGGFYEAATQLQITPHINEEGGVRLQIMTTVDQFLPSQMTPTGQSLTRITEREADTEVTVEDSRTVVIGGLTRQTLDTRVQRVPILGSIPVLGVLFRRTVEEERDRHLYIFITPTVHRTAESMSAEAERSRRAFESLRPGQPLRLPGMPPDLSEVPLGDELP